MSRLALPLVALIAAGCQSAETPPMPGPERAQAEAAAPRVLAEAAGISVPLRIEVVGARRLSTDAVRIELVVARPAGDGVQDQGVETAIEAAVGALADASLLSADGHRRVFSLRDAAGRPVGGPLEVPEPGGRRTTWMVFTGQPGDSGPVTLLLPGFPPLRSLPVAP
jgi:hypothetical protein